MGDAVAPEVVAAGRVLSHVVPSGVKQRLLVCPCHDKRRAVVRVARLCRLEGHTCGGVREPCGHGRRGMSSLPARAKVRCMGGVFKPLTRRCQVRTSTAPAVFLRLSPTTTAVAVAVAAAPAVSVFGADPLCSSPLRTLPPSQQATSSGSASASSGLGTLLWAIWKEPLPRGGQPPSSEQPCLRGIAPWTIAGFHAAFSVHTKVRSQGRHRGWTTAAMERWQGWSGRSYHGHPATSPRDTPTSVRETAASAGKGKRRSQPSGAALPTCGKRLW
eukprot:156633-Chlamydomonas_euryale.AAC.2